MTVTFAGVMLPDDANPAGHVHGGSILKMVEHAGYIAASRHCNGTEPSSSSSLASATGNHNNNKDDPVDPIYPSLARLESMDFFAPMFIGEVAQLEARVSYASARTVEVEVDVWAENPVASSDKGRRRKTNQAHLWYVGVRLSGSSQNHWSKPPTVTVVEVPKVLGLTAEEEEAGRIRHEQSKTRRASESKELARWSEGNELTSSSPSSLNGGDDTVTAPTADGGRSVRDSAAELVQMVLPSDCYQGPHGPSYCFGGVIMKLVDNAGGIVALRHCRSNVVTASIEGMTFNGPTSNGDILHVRAVPTFASSRSLEVVVKVETENILSGAREKTAHCRLTFVSLSEKGEVQTIPKLLVSSESEKENFEAGKKRYEEKKMMRRKKLKQ